MRQPTQPNNLFDLAEAQRLRDTGINAATEPAHRREMLHYAREIARRICLQAGKATSDDVAEAMHADGIPYDALGNAAGAVFKDKMFVATGEYRQSTRIASHARIVRVWKLADRE